MEGPHHDRERRERWEEGYVAVRRQKWLRRARIRRHLRGPTDSRVVEIGSGDGLNLEVLAELGFRRVLGLEYSLDLIARGSSRRVAAGDAHALPFATGGIDLVLVDSVLHHLTDYAAAARELSRVLRPAGRLVYFEPRPSLARRLLDRVTFSAWGRRLPYLRARHQTLLEEIDLYGHWLDHHREMEGHLVAAGLTRRFRWRGPIGLFAGFDKPRSGARA